LNLALSIELPSIADKIALFQRLLSEAVNTL